MSFILDALRKSESERQRDAGAVLARVPIAAARPIVPIWVWVALAVLTTAVVILGGGWWQSMRGGGTGLGANVTGAGAGAETAAAVRSPGEAPSRDDGSRAGALRSSDDPGGATAPARGTQPREGVTAADGAAPAGVTPSPGPGLAATTAPAIAVEPGPQSQPFTAPPSPEALASNRQTPAEAAARPAPARGGTARGPVPTMADLAASGLALPELTLEFHVYHDNPAYRFVFINGGRYAEGQRLKDGPTVVEIRPVGVVLNQAGRDFLLLPQ